MAIEELPGKDTVMSNGVIYQGPDMSGFMRKIERIDFSRPNLFAVNFSDFRKAITSDGVIDFDDEPILSDIMKNNVQSGTDFIWNKATDALKDYALKNMSDGVKSIFGAYDPELVQTIFGNEVIDFFSGPAYDVNKDVCLLAKRASIPGVSFETEKTYQDKKPFSNIKGRSVDNVSMTFYCTPNYAERSLFLAWMNKIHNPKTNKFSFFDSVKQRIEIATYNRRGKIASVAICQDCIPVRVGPVDLDFDSNNQIATFEVEFEVSHMVHVPYDDTYGSWNEIGSAIDRGNQSVEAITGRNKTTSTIRKLTNIFG